MSVKKQGENYLIDKITPEQARTVLRKLWESNSSVKDKIEALIREMLSDVDYKEVCEDVTFSLEELNVEDVYEHSGRRRDGYHDPGDVAIEMLEEACREYEEQMKRYHELGMYDVEKEYCKGVLLALYRFEQYADKDFLAQAPDVAASTFEFIFENWKKRCLNKKHIEEMDKFIAAECGNWKL